MTHDAVNSEELAVVAKLLADGRRPFRLTSVAQAAQSLGLRLEIEGRLRVGYYLASHIDASPILRRWGAPTFVLTKEEKLLGRSLQFAGRPLTVAEITELGQIDDRAVEAGLRTLVDLNLASLLHSRYRLVPDWASRLGPLGWTFHTVALHGEGSFNVPCAVDFLLLAAGAYRGRELVIEDSCVHCTDPIRVAIHPGLRVEAYPRETVILGGSG